MSKKILFVAAKTKLAKYKDRRSFLEFTVLIQELRDVRCTGLCLGQANFPRELQTNTKHLATM